MKPFLRWPGGKGRLLPRLRPLLRIEHDRLVEPFVGGGSIYFDRQPAMALLADVNADLIECYRVVRDDVGAVLAALGACTWSDGSAYYATRDADPAAVAALSPAERAARFVFLNRSAFHGLQRQNRAGRPNAAFGSPRKWTRADDHHLRQCAKALASAEFMHGDFAETLQHAQPGDLVFCDPPYAGRFTGYTAGGFDEQDRARLAAQLHELDKRGVRWLLTDSDTEALRDLYTRFHFTEMRTRYNIAGSGKDRHAVSELAISNYESGPSMNVNGKQSQQAGPSKLQVAAKDLQQSRRGRPDDKAVTERLGLAAELLRSNTSRPEILRVFRERFHVSTRTVDGYIRRVRERWQADAVAAAGSAGPGVAEGRAAERSTFLAELSRDIEQAKEAGVWSAVAQLRKLAADVRGLRVVAPAPAPAAPSVTVNNITLSDDDRRHRVLALSRAMAREREALALVESTGEPVDEANESADPPS